MKMKSIPAVIAITTLLGITGTGSRAEDAPAYARWKEFSAKIKSEPALLLYYTFEENEGVKVVNQAAGTGIKGYKPTNYNGELEGGAKVTKKHGRWPGKGGVNFDGQSMLTAPNALYSLDMGKDKMPITVIYWIYVAEADGGIHGTIFSLGNDGEQRCSAHNPWEGNLYWDHGNIGAGGRLNTPYSDYYDKWHQVALVSGGKEGSSKAIFVDGEEIVSEPSSDGPDKDLEGLWLGNCPAYSADSQIAKMDEFMIFARALNEKEIKNYFKMGKP